MTVIRRDRTYRHPHLIDVDMHVVRILYLAVDFFILDVAWVRRWGDVCWPDTVKLKFKDVNNWVAIKT